MGHSSPTRFAFVVANGAYGRIGALPNALNDQRRIVERLRGLGIDVQTCTDASKDDFDAALDRFAATLDAAKPVDAAVFYFAGHGCQEGTSNYLLPVPDADGRIEGISLSRVLHRLDGRAAARIVFLDACRDYFDRSGAAEAMGRTRGIDPGGVTLTPGLGERDYGAETFIAFSAAPGQPASDGDADTGLSPFAAALVDCIDRVERPIASVMQEVRERVRKATADRQETWDASSLSRTFYFRPFPYLVWIANILPVLAICVTVAVLALAFAEQMVALYQGAAMHWPWIALAFALVMLAVGLHTHGLRRITGWSRGDAVASGDDAGLWPTGWQSALGGLSSGLVGMPLMALPYWWNWRVTGWGNGEYGGCRDIFFLDPEMPLTCPTLVRLMVEISVAGICLQAILAALSVSLAVRFLNSGATMLRGVSPHVRFVAGATFGGGVAGIGLGGITVGYFGALDRPFFEPTLILGFAVLCVFILAYAVVNYSLLRFSVQRLLRSLVGAGLAGVVALALIGLMVALLYSSDVIEAVFQWAFANFWFGTGTLVQRFAYLFAAGAVYGLAFGLFLGLMIGLAFVFTRIELNRAVAHHAPRAVPAT